MYLTASIPSDSALIAFCGTPLCPLKPVHFIVQVMAPAVPTVGPTSAESIQKRGAWRQKSSSPFLASSSMPTPDTLQFS